MRSAPNRFDLVSLALFVGLFATTPSGAGQGDCAQPVSAGDSSTATDCLFILNVSVGLVQCTPACACAPTGALPASVTDALVCLNRAVGIGVETACPCSDPLWFPVDVALATDLGHTPVEIAASERIDAGPLTFEDVTVTAGLGGAVGGGNMHGVAVAFADLTGDGWEDVVVVNGRFFDTQQQFDSYYYANDGDGTFSDNAMSSGFAAIMQNVDGYSVAAADYDHDGDVDLYIGAHPRDILLENTGAGEFFDATFASGAGGPPTSQTGSASKVVSFGDFDSDGNLDLVSASSDIPGPGLYLLRNDGDATFTDVTVSSGAAIDAQGNPCAVLWSDYGNDGDADLHIWNDLGGRALLRNVGDGSFLDVTAASGLDTQADISNPMGIDAADIDHDGDLDYYVSNIGNNPLLRNDGEGSFTNITSSAGTGGEFGWGLGFEDFDLDTHPDIFVAQEDDRPFIAFSNSGAVPSSFSRTNVSHVAVASTSRAHNVPIAFADYDHDGRVDVLAAATDGSRISLFRNTTEVGTNRWLEVDVPEVPLTGAAGATTARVFVKAGPLLQFREVYGGSSRASQNATAVGFGLGQRTGADWVAVQWPDGRQLVVRGVEGNRRLSLGP